MNNDNGNVLIIDDNTFNRMILEQSLRKLGYRVKLTASGKEGLAAVRSERIDVILLDLVMPEMDGYEVLDRLKKDDALRHIPVIIVSGVTDMSKMINCVKAGAADFLPKPVGPVLLQARLKSALQTNQLSDAQTAYTEQLEKRNEELDAFAHDLKTSITELLGSAYLLNDGDDEALIANRSRISSIVDIGNHMNNVTNKFMLLAAVANEKATMIA